MVHSCRTLMLSAATCLVLAGGARDAGAQHIEILHAFPASPAYPQGRLLEIAPGTFIGTSERGGAYDQGSIYLLYRRADTTWATYTLHSFYEGSGRNPIAGVIRATDGNFYGTTPRGGLNDPGTIFRLTPLLQYTVLHAFTDETAPGRGPIVQASDGALWGTGAADSTADMVYRITLTGQFTRVHAFSVSDGSIPGALVKSRDGNLYGTTEAGGDGHGTVFRLTMAGALSTLHTFGSDDGGNGPYTMIEAADGHLYGARRDGGRHSVGFTFRITRTGAHTRLHDFDGLMDGIWYPVPGSFVQGPDGFLYGTTGGYLAGTTPSFDGGAVYRMTLDGAVERVADLDNATYGGPPDGLIVGADGRLYGTTRHGQRPSDEVDANSGVMFSLPLAGPPEVLYNFATLAPARPLGRLAEGPDGKLYGSSCLGGRYNRGTVFRFDASVVTTLHSFTGADGACPVGGVAIGSDGSMHGTTVMGLSSQTRGGTIYRTAPDGTHTTLSESDGSTEPGFSLAAPSKGPDGGLYVPLSSIYGGAGANSAVMRIESNGTVTRFAEFSGLFGTVGGYFPSAALTLASDGNFYGTTSTSPGGVFRLLLDGTLAPVRLFPHVGGPPLSNLRGGLTQGADGRLFGASARGGWLDAGMIYATALNGATSVLHEFSYLDGLAPTGELLETSPGRFLGVTFGIQDPRFGVWGSVYEITAGGVFRIVHRFSRWDGANPFAGLTRTRAGAIYGVTSTGGPFGGGVIFRIVP